MNHRRTILAGSIILGLMIWVMDAALDALIFYEGTFLQLLVTDVPRHEIYIRAVVLVSFFVFGLIVSSLIAQRDRAQTSLRENQQTLSTVMHHLPGIAYRAINDEKWTMLFISEGAFDLTGYRSQALVHNRDIAYVDIIHPEDRDLVRDEISKALERAAHFELEYRIITADEETKWVWEQGRGIPPDGGGEPRVLEGFITDISRRKATEEALSRSRARLREAESVAHVGHYTIDIPTGQASWSNETFRIFGLDPDANEPDVAGYQDMVHEADRDDVYTMFRRAVEFGDHFDLVYRIYRADGETRYVHSIAYPESDADGNVIKLFGTLQDVTERRRADAALRDQARQLRQVMNTVPEGVMLLDQDHRILLANRVAERILEELSEACVGDQLSRLGDRPLEKLLTSPPRGRWHEIATAAHTFEAIAQPVAHGANPESWVLVIGDVTEERIVREQAQRQERLAAIGQLAAGVAHDFNNILSVITLYSQMSLRESADLPAKTQQYLEAVAQEARRATDLVQQILNFGRPTALEPQPTDLLALLEEQVNLVDRAFPDDIHVHLATCLGTGPEAYRIHADPTQLQQVIMNLLVNARDAMPEGGDITIELDRLTINHHQSAPLPNMGKGDWIKLTVEDTGTGIPPNVLPRIFDPFFTTKAPHGSGLGLAQVSAIIAQHGGMVDVATTVGEGTTFFIYLPAAPDRVETVTHQDRSCLPRGHRELILVVEDNPAVRHALAGTLESLNYDVIEAGNGLEALAHLDQASRQTQTGSSPNDRKAISLILSDLVMPQMGGAALLHAVASRGIDVPLIMLSGHAKETELQSLKDQGLSDWLLKPPKIDELAEILATHITR